MLAAGDPRLSDWYGKLCVDGKKLSEVEDVRHPLRRAVDAITDFCEQQLKAATDSEEINQAAVETIEPDLRNYQARQENEFEVSDPTGLPNGTNETSGRGFELISKS